MSRDIFDVELGYAISAENGDRQVYLLSGTAVPDGTSGKQSEAPIGSLYIRSGTGELYQKIANAGAPADYKLNGSAAASIGNWRPERVDAQTGQVLTAGVTDPTAWSDNDGGADGTNFTVGHYILDGNCNLWEITVITSATSITVAAAATAPVADDTFAVKYNLPDPAGQENQAIIVYDGTNCIKVADVDFANASGITTDAGYTPGSGDPIGGESVLATLQKLDGNNDAQDSVLGTAQGATNLGAFTAPADFLLTATETVKSALQKIADYLFGIKVTQTVGVTTAVAVDSVAHATYKRVQWIVEVFETATPANREGFVIDVLTDGTALGTDDTKYAKLKTTNIAGLTSNVVINGANLELQIGATPSCTVNVRRITVV